MKPRVLIVDDDDGVRVELEKTLDRTGFQVTTAEDCLSGWALFEKSNFDLVILDLRMPDFENNISKRAGIDFLKRIRALENRNKASIRVLVLTGFASVEGVKDALNLGATNYVEKHEIYQLKDRLLAEIKENLSSNESRNFDLIIDTSEGLALTDENIEVFQKLYSECRQISISPLLPGYSTARVFLVDSINLKGEKLIPFVTKIGDKSQIDIEHDNFKQYVEHKVGSGRYPEIIKVASSDSESLAGMRLSFIGADWRSMLDLKTYFKTHDSADVCTVIEKLFEETFKFWHENKGHKEPLAILEHYGFFADFKKLRTAMDRFFKEYKGHEIIRFKDVSEAFYNPITSLEIFNEAFKNLKIKTYVCTTHGDLNVRNVLVDNNKAGWLLDFQYTGKGHILTDFIELETSIKYGCFDARFEDCWDLEKCLLSQADFRDDLHFNHSNPEIKKAFDVVKKMREYAYLSVAPSRDMTEYYIGLIYYSLNMLRFPEKVISKDKKKSILLAVSLLFDRLKEPGMKIGFVGKNEYYLLLRQSTENEGKFKVLIVDDDEIYFTNLYKTLDRAHNYNVVKAGGAIEAARILEENKWDMFNLCILDLWMPDLSGNWTKTAGLDLLKFIKEKYPDVPVVILSGDDSFQTVVDSMRLYGAANYFHKDNTATNKEEFLAVIEDIIKESLKNRLEKIDQQKALSGILKTLPKQPPQLEVAEIDVFHKSLKEVGGDLYDFIRLDDNKLALSIGDVAGKGLSAAVLMTKYFSFSRASLTRDYDSLPSLISRWNDFIIEQKTDSDYLTLFFATLNQENLTLKYCNAGHNPPFIVRKEGEIIDLSEGGRILGYLENEKYIESLVELASGDVLVMYTDGFSEAENPYDEEYGVDRLKETARANRHLPARQIMQSLIDSFESFTDNTTQNDDRTLVILKIK